MKVHSMRKMGVILIEPKRFGDHRGFFAETYRRRTYSSFGMDVEFVQDKHSLSAVGCRRHSTEAAFSSPPACAGQVGALWARRDSRCGGRYPSRKPNLWQMGGLHVEC